MKAVTAGAKDWFAKLFAQRFFHDRLSLGLFVASLGLNLINLIVLLAKLRPLEFSTTVPVHYSNLNNGFDALGPWYLNYRIGLFALGVTLVNTYLAVLAYSRSRIASFYLIAGSVVVAIFSLIISAAFISIL